MKMMTEKVFRLIMMEIINMCAFSKMKLAPKIETERESVKMQYCQSSKQESNEATTKRKFENGSDCMSTKAKIENIRNVLVDYRRHGSCSTIVLQCTTNMI